MMDERSSTAIIFTAFISTLGHLMMKCFSSSSDRNGGQFLKRFPIYPNHHWLKHQHLVGGKGLILHLLQVSQHIVSQDLSLSLSLSYLQCSVSCGYGIQSRTVSCLGPSSPLPITPILCVHLPKPITIQACYYSTNCSTPAPSTAPTGEPEAWSKKSAWKLFHEEKRTTSAPAGDTEKFSEVLPTVPVLRSTSTLSTQPPQSS